MDAKKSTARRATSPCSLSTSPVITQSDLDEVLAEDDIVRQWEPGKYTLIKTLAGAAAGNGIVELMSSEEQAGQKVAVKRLPFHLVRASAEDFNRNVEDKKEQPWIDIAIVKLLNRLNFPYVCELFGVFRGIDGVNIVTSFATNEDLLSWANNDTTVEGEEREAAMRPMVLQMFKAVCWLHDLGIAHRDLSVENVMLTDANDGGVQVKIIDFCMATLSRTAKREVRGKRSYQAPEMHQRTRYDTLLVDNFALGVILFMMGTRCYPWEYTIPGRSRSFDFACQHGLEMFLHKKRIARVGKSVSEILSPSLQELLCGLLDFDPEMRYSLGERCFESLFRMHSTWYPTEDLMSEITTACSSLSSVGSSSEDECGIGDLETAKPLQSRSSVWDSKWLQEKYV